MSTKLFVLFGLVACVFGGVLKDATGGTFDLTTGQYSSAITGRVYNTAPVVAAAPVAHYAAPVAHYTAPVAHYTAPYAYGYGYGLAAPYAYGGYYY